MFTKIIKSLLPLLFLSNLAFASSVINPSALQFSRPHIAHVPNGVIEYYDIGSGKPIVLIAGYGSNVSGWDKQFVAALASRYRVILFDNRNVGGSLINSNSYTSADLANDTYHLVQALHLQKPVIMGISMGGMLAQQYAILHPEAMSKLILINTAIAGTACVQPSRMVQEKMSEVPNYRAELYLRAVKLFFPANARPEMALALLGDRFHSVYAKEKPISTEIINKQLELVRAWSQDNMAEKMIHHLPMPVLILNGGADEVIPPINSVILQHTIPQATLLRWANGGHAMIYQYPYPIANAIMHFIG